MVTEESLFDGVHRPRSGVRSEIVKIALAVRILEYSSIDNPLKSFQGIRQMPAAGGVQRFAETVIGILQEMGHQDIFVRTNLLKGYSSSFDPCLRFCIKIVDKVSVSTVEHGSQPDCQSLNIGLEVGPVLNRSNQRPFYFSRLDANLASPERLEGSAGVEEQLQLQLAVRPSCSTQHCLCVCGWHKHGD